MITAAVTNNGVWITLAAIGVAIVLSTVIAALVAAADRRELASEAHVEGVEAFFGAVPTYQSLRAAARVEPMTGVAEFELASIRFAAAVAAAHPQATFPEFTRITTAADS